MNPNETYSHMTIPAVRVYLGLWNVPFEIEEVQMGLDGTATLTVRRVPKGKESSVQATVWKAADMGVQEGP